MPKITANIMTIENYKKSKHYYYKLIEYLYDAKNQIHFNGYENVRACVNKDLYNSLSPYIRQILECDFNVFFYTSAYTEFALYGSVVSNNDLIGIMIILINEHWSDEY